MGEYTGTRRWVGEGEREMVSDVIFSSNTLVQRHGGRSLRFGLHGHIDKTEFRAAVRRMH